MAYNLHRQDRISGSSIEDLGGNQRDDVYTTERQTPKIRRDRVPVGGLASVGDVRRHQSLSTASAKPAGFDFLGYAD
jgi:hypothetical protein